MNETVFPPRTWLGFGLDMTLTTPTDINSIANLVLRASRLLKLSETSTQETVQDIAWSVPDNIVFSAGTNTSSSRFPHPFIQAIANPFFAAAYEYYESGTAASNAIRSDASVSARFMAISGSASLHHSVAQSFNVSMQYSMFSFSHTLARVGFDSWGADINSDVLKQRLTGVVPFPSGNDPDPSITSAYASLFRNVGSHVITDLSFGSRLQLVSLRANLQRVGVGSANCPPFTSAYPVRQLRHLHQPKLPCQPQLRFQGSYHGGQH